MAEIIRSVKGTRDFYPDLMAVRRWMFDIIREVSTSFGYQEYDGPTLEFLELYAAKSGEELVKEQSFVFTSRGDEELTLRPELTPTLARMVAQKQYEIPLPLRWWSILSVEHRPCRRRHRCRRRGNRCHCRDLP